MKLQSLIHWQICQSLPHYTHINSIVKSTSNANPTNKIRTEMPNSNSKLKGIFYLYTPSEDLSKGGESNRMNPTKSNRANRIQMGVQSGHKKRILVAKTEAATVPFSPNPELAINEQ